MHYHVLNKNQEVLLPYLKTFSRSFYLVGGTAVALHIGHRRSIDFDLFTNKELNKSLIRKKLNGIPFGKKQIFTDTDQLHILCNKVKLTFFSYPYHIKHLVKIKSYLSMPELIDLAAMKAYALGRRSKWKDYVDLYYILKNHFSLEDICKKANNYFKDYFSEKLFRGQLAFHQDIDFSEQIDYLIPNPPGEKKIKKFLIEVATEPF